MENEGDKIVCLGCGRVNRDPRVLDTELVNYNCGYCNEKKLQRVITKYGPTDRPTAAALGATLGILLIILNPWCALLIPIFAIVGWFMGEKKS